MTGRDRQKFAGSGGTITGTYADAAMLDRVRTALAAIGSRTIEPIIEGGAQRAGPCSHPSVDS